MPNDMNMKRMASVGNERSRFSWKLTVVFLSEEIPNLTQVEAVKVLRYDNTFPHTSRDHSLFQSLGRKHSLHAATEVMCGET